jgi:microcystin-dependent protein
MNTQTQLLAAAYLALVALAAPLVPAADVFGPPTTIDYSGRVLDNAGAPLGAAAPTNYQIQFRLYDAQSGGVPVWAEQQLVTVSDGQFSVRLGEGDGIPIVGGGGATEGAVPHDVNPARTAGLPAAFKGSERYLGVTVLFPGTTPSEIVPRLSFLTSPFAFVAETAKVAQTVNQPAGSTPSSLNVGTIAFDNGTLLTSGDIPATSHTVLADATTSTLAAPLVATLPPGVSALNRQLQVIKKDDTDSFVIVQPTTGGSLNGTVNGKVTLKVRGESVTIQNTGANDWWIISERRDTTPVGTIQSIGGNVVPKGYKLCDATLLNRTEFPELFAAIGTNWGTTTATNFQCPDLRGAFLRGKDSGRGFDDNAANRINYGNNQVVGDVVGSYQLDSFKSHDHTGTTVAGGDHSHSVQTQVKLSTSENGANGFNGGGFKTTDRDVFTVTNPSEIPSATTNSSGSHTHTIPAQGGSETRPENFSVNYIIKY